MAESAQTDTNQIDHDGLFKELIHQCFEMFLRLFFPREAALLDFSAFTFLEQELLTDYPSGEHRYIDTLVEVRTLTGELILIHIEFQSTRRSGFPRRMFRYFSQLRLRRDTPIWQIAVYMPGGSGGVGFETYTEAMFGEAFLPFRYWCVSLADLDAAAYQATANPVAYGLAPLMNRGDISHPRLKAICLNGIATSNITQAQSALLAHFVETYLPLTEAEQEEFEGLIHREEVSVMQFITSWERQGITKGLLQARREVLLSLLGEKFGTVPPLISQQVQTIESSEALDRLLRQLIHANSIAELGLDGKKE